MSLSSVNSSNPLPFDRGMQGSSSFEGAVRDALAGKLTMPEVSDDSLTSRLSSDSSVGEPLEVSTGTNTPVGSKIDDRFTSDAELIHESITKMRDPDPLEDIDTLLNESSKLKDLQNQKDHKVEKHKNDLLDMSLDRLSATTSNTFTRVIKNKLLDVKLALITFRHEKALDKLNKEMGQTRMSQPSLSDSMRVRFNEDVKVYRYESKEKTNPSSEDLKEVLSQTQPEEMDIKHDLAAAEQVLNERDNFLELDDLIDSLHEDEDFDSVDFDDEMDAANRLLDQEDFDDLIDKLSKEGEGIELEELTGTDLARQVRNQVELDDLLNRLQVHNDPDDELPSSSPPTVQKDIQPLSEDIKPKAGTWEARGETAPENKVSDLKKKFEDLK